MGKTGNDAGLGEHGAEGGCAAHEHDGVPVYICAVASPVEHIDAGQGKHGHAYHGDHLSGNAVDAVGEPQNEGEAEDDEKELFLAGDAAELLHVVFEVFHPLELLDFAGHENDEAQPDAGNKEQHYGHADSGPFHEADVKTGGLFQNLDGRGVCGAAGGSGHAAEEAAAAYAE